LVSHVGAERTYTLDPYAVNRYPKRLGCGVKEKEAMVFFFGKKNQKTFIRFEV